ncbi:hypothetical protein H9P43_005801 [Blastocladiella emersonii ATCC 22665]|nr:hypothetical protein H9P43_005801 [Blastocladiella emersonii ATCC 22665]
MNPDATDSQLTRRIASAMLSRRQRGLARTLTDVSALGIPASHDFASNDYLGLARSPAVAAAVESRLRTSQSDLVHGSTGSRLLSGHSRAAADLETKLAAIHGAPAALLCNSGYTANLLILATLPAPGDAVLLDAHVHASVWDGVRLAVGRVASKKSKKGGEIAVHTFPHNDVNGLRDAIGRIRAAGVQGSIFVAVEAVYSMDGSTAPLAEMAAMLAALGDRDVHLVVDEAHSSGVLGPDGAGLVSALGIEDQVPIRVHTFGKAIGCHGAVVFCAPETREFLLNYARPLVYSTMMPPSALAAIDAAYTHLSTHHSHLASTLAARAATFTSAVARTAPWLPLVPGGAHIQGILVPGNAAVVRVARALLARGFYTLPIRSPTVAAGEERIRVCLHTYNDTAAIEGLVAAVAEEVRREQQMQGTEMEMQAKL